jgi:hypothetical protein
MVAVQVAADDLVERSLSGLEPMRITDDKTRVVAGDKIYLRVK